MYVQLATNGSFSCLLNAFVLGPLLATRYCGKAFLYHANGCRILRDFSLRRLALSCPSLCKRDIPVSLFFSFRFSHSLSPFDSPSVSLPSRVTFPTIPLSPPSNTCLFLGLSSVHLVHLCFALICRISVLGCLRFCLHLLPRLFSLFHTEGCLARHGGLCRKIARASAACGSGARHRARTKFPSRRQWKAGTNPRRGGALWGV